MIKTISTNTPQYIKIGHYSGMHIDAYSGNANQGGVGQMRWNPNSQTMEVWDGNGWKNVVGHADLSLTDDTVQLLEWARKERDRQLNYEALARENVTIADALESVKDAELRLRELAILCEKSEKNNTDGSA